MDVLFRENKKRNTEKEQAFYLEGMIGQETDVRESRTAKRFSIVFM